MSVLESWMKRKLLPLAVECNGEAVPATPNGATAPGPTASNRISIVETWAILMLGLTVMITTLLWWCFLNRGLLPDEVGLANPPYMYLHQGKITYPIHGQHDYMVVHPPVQYFVIAWFMKLGLNCYHAAGAACVALAVVFVFTLVTSKLNNGLKVALMTAYVIVMVGFPCMTIRPEYPIAAGWFAGLVALESSRCDRWNWKRLLLGGLLLAYASTLHYWAFPAAAGLIVYAAFVCRELGYLRAAQRCWPLLAGALVVYVPYLVYFLIPYWPGVIAMVKAVGATGSLSTSYHNHVLNLRTVLAQLNYGCMSLVRHIYYPSQLAKLPLILAALPVLLLIPSTRRLALAGSALPLFVLLCVQRKGGPWYSLPEFLLYTAGFVVLIVLSIQAVGRIIPRLPAAAVTTVTALAAAAFLCWFSHRQYQYCGLTAQYDDLEIARAAGKAMFGRNALIATANMHLWYTTGAAKLYHIANGDIAQKDLTNGDLAHLDAVAFADDWFANQTTSRPFPRWYVNGQLHLKGFYVHYWPGGCESIISKLYVHPKKSLAITGYCYNQSTHDLERFQEDGQGDYVCVTLAAPTYVRSFPHAKCVCRIAMENPSIAADNLFLVMVPRSKYEELKPTLLNAGVIRDAVAGTLRPVDRRRFLKHFLRSDPPIQFPRTCSEALAMSADLRLGEATPVCLSPINRPDGYVRMLDKSSDWCVYTNRSNTDWQLQSAPIGVKTNSCYLVSADVELQKGGMYLAVYNPQTHEYLSDLRREWPQECRSEKFVIQTGNSSQILIAIANNSLGPNLKARRSCIAIRNLELRQVGLGQ